MVHYLGCGGITVDEPRALCDSGAITSTQLHQRVQTRYDMGIGIIGLQFAKLVFT